MFLDRKIFNVFFKNSLSHQACISLIQNTAKAVILWNIFTIYNNCFLFEYILKCNLFLWFQSWILASLLQSHDPSEIILIFWFAKKNTFIIIIIMLKTAE